MLALASVHARTHLVYEHRLFHIIVSRYWDINVTVSTLVRVVVLSNGAESIIMLHDEHSPLVLSNESVYIGLGVVLDAELLGTIDHIVQVDLIWDLHSVEILN